MSLPRAPWPYEQLDGSTTVRAPSWECLEGICECGAHGQDRLFEFSVMLCDPHGRRMTGARCRVLLSGVCLNEGTPYADEQGWITVLLKREPESLTLEWAPPNTPLDPELPYRLDYFVQLSAPQPEEAARRRLANLGFSSHFDLREEIEDFQVHYRYTEVTGKLDDVEEALRLYHDAACLPVVRADQPQPPVASDRAPAPATGKPVPLVPPNTPPAPPPRRGGIKIGGELPPGQGTARPVPAPRPDCHFSFVLHAARDGSVIRNEPYRLHLARGKIHSGVVDNAGRIEYGDVAPGDYLLQVGATRLMVPALRKEEVDRPLLVTSDQGLE